MSGLPVNFSKGSSYVTPNTVVKMFYPGAAIVAGDAVMIAVATAGGYSATTTVIQATADAAGSLAFVGVALEAASAASTSVPIAVAVKGLVVGAKTDTVTAGDAIAMDLGGTAGKFDTVTVGTDHVLGVAVSSGTTTANLWLYGQGEAYGL